MDSALLRDVSLRYDLDLQAEEMLAGGEESRIVRVCSADRRLVVRVSPAWRTLAELTWAYELASYAAGEIREALAPVPALDGSPAFERDGHVVSVFPFADGEMLDRSSEPERDSAARLLARLHQVLPTWPQARPRPASGPGAPPRVPHRDPPGLADPELDAAFARLTAGMKRVPSHADFYRGNLRCMDGRVVALFDWDDARYERPEYELAWSVWEFAQAEAFAGLDVDRARRFIDVYSASGGPAALGASDFVIPFIRIGLRVEVRRAHAWAEAGITYDADYIERARTAFDALGKLGSDSKYTELLPPRRSNDVFRV